MNEGNKLPEAPLKTILPHTSIGKKALAATIVLILLGPIFRLAAAVLDIEPHESLFSHPGLGLLTIIAIVIWLAALILGALSIWKQKERASSVIVATSFLALFTFVFVLAVATD